MRFSKGNLRYNAAFNAWKLADNQYDYVGKDNNNIAPDYNGWIDLFGWGTSGWESGAVAYQPWDTTTIDSNYWVGGYWCNGLFDGYEQADWGYHNIIVTTAGTSGVEYVFNMMKSAKQFQDSFIDFSNSPEVRQ